jgi:hypothetical protein
MSKKTNPISFTNVMLKLHAYLFFGVGLLLLIFPEESSIFTMEGETARVVNVIQQFLGSAYILLGLFAYALKDTIGKNLYFIIASLNLVGFINLYLIFVCSELIHLPSIYFVLQILLQLVLLVALIEQVKKN